MYSYYSHNAKTTSDEMEEVPRENEHAGLSSSEPLSIEEFIEEGKANLQPRKPTDQGRHKEGKVITGHQTGNSEKGVHEAGTGTPTNVPSNMKAAIHIAKFPISVKDGRAKYVTVRNFRGQVYVDIRDYYESGGQYFPSKKGITLAAREFKAVMSLSKNITRAIYSGKNQ